VSWTVAVTGASGHLGANLLPALQAHGDCVFLMLRRPPPARLAAMPVACRQAALDDPAALAEAFAGADAVVHLAAMIDMRAGMRASLAAVNVTGTRNVLDACRRAGVARLLYVSSIEALDPWPLDAPLTETRPLVPASRRGYDYAWSKARAEALVRAAPGLPETVIVNPTAVLGPRDYGPSLMGNTLFALANGRLPALVPGGFDWVDARDVAAATAAALHTAPAGARYILSGRWAELQTLAEILRRELGTRRPPPRVPLALARWSAPMAEAWARLRKRRPGLTPQSVRIMAHSHRDIRHARAAADLAYAPRPLVETVCDSYRWLAQRSDAAATRAAHA